MVTQVYVWLYLIFGAARIWLAPDSWAALVAVAVVFLALAARSDLATRQLSNRLNGLFLAGALAAVGAKLVIWGGAYWIFWRCCLAALAVFAVFWLVHVLAPQGLGGGDVKLVPALGVVLGSVSWGAVWLGLGLAFLLNGLAAAIVLLGSRSQNAGLPFAPTLGSGTLLALVLLAG